MSFFITLIEDSDADRRALEDEPRVHAMIHHGLKLEEYRAFLHDLYHIVWHFCPVMAAAAARCGDEFRDVRYELYERIEEEKGHEDWVLEDVEAMGGDVAGVRANAAQRARAGHDRVQLPWRRARAPVLGAGDALHARSRVVRLRGQGVGLDRASARQGRRTAGGFKFLSSHATMDVDHMAKLNKLVKTIADPAAQRAIINSTRVNFYQFRQMFGEGGFVPPAA